ncbi:MAG: baeRF3 domain-containing protein [Arachnia sp.]
MDLLTDKDIQKLATTGNDGVHVSLLMPTHRYGAEVQADQLQWKNLVNGVEAVLQEEMRRPDIEALLKPARDLQHDSMAWQYMSDGLAMFLTPDSQQTYRLPAPLPELATVGDRFITGPLMHLLSGDEHYLMLGLSQNEVRLLDGSRHSVVQVELDSFPTSLEDAIEPAESRSSTMARPTGGGRGGRAVFFGHGTGDDSARENDLNLFMRQVADGLSEILRDQHIPLVLVGLDASVAAYRDANKYGNVLDEAVIRNPDQLSAQELHDLAWPIVEARLRAERQTVIDRFHELNGTGRVASDLSAVGEAAEQGRVDTLFLRAQPWCWERTSRDDLAVVRLGKDERYAECEALDKAAVDTLSNGGVVYATSHQVADDSEVAAIMRY